MNSYYSDLIDMANKIITNQMKNQNNEYFLQLMQKTIINKTYKYLSTYDINNSHVGKGTKFIKGFEEASYYLEYCKKFDFSLMGKIMNIIR